MVHRHVEEESLTDVALVAVIDGGHHDPFGAARIVGAQVSDQLAVLIPAVGTPVVRDHPSIEPHTR